MPAAQAAERLAAAHSEVRRACDRLMAASPGAWIDCQEALEGAVRELTQYREQIHQVPIDRNALALARSLRAEVLRAARLLESLSSFYRGWERILGAMSAGYTAGGDPAPISRNSRLYCRG